MDDFLHHLIVVAAFSTAALLVKLALWIVAFAGVVDAAQNLSSAVQMSVGLAAAIAAHYRTRYPRTAVELARTR